MVPEIVDQIPEDAVMYLVNAMAFQGEWEEVYRENQRRTGSRHLERRHHRQR